MSRLHHAPRRRFGRLSSVLCFLSFAWLVSAQTNTFPSSGNVGIGTTGPGQALTLGTNKNLRMDWGGGTDTTIEMHYSADYRQGINFEGNNRRLTLYNYRADGSDTELSLHNGNVGIGTTSPNAPLEVRRDTTTGTLGGRITINNFAGASYASAALDMNTTNVGSNDPQTRIQAMDNADWSANLIFGTKTPGSNSNALTERLRITSSGNIGIGTAAASIATVARLHLHSDFNNSSTGLMIDASDTTDPERYNLRLFPYVVGPAKVGYTFQTKSATGGTNIPLAFDHAGNVGIGTTNPSHKLAVNGTIKAKEVIVETTGWSDYVFAEDYRLAPLAEVEAHIFEKKHLPGIPSAAEVEQGGVSLGDMQARLLAKVEELTLHVIRIEKENAAQSTRLAALEQENALLRQQPSSPNLTVSP